MPLIHSGFLLKNRTAEHLYETYAAEIPIFDFHSHLNASDLLKNDNYPNLTRLWLGSDHYKWRLMRIAGVEEKYITGDGDDYEKFLRWAAVAEKAAGNPLYHWTQLELVRYFGIGELLNRETAPEIWKKTGELLQDDAFRPSGLLARLNVKGVCTTNDPAGGLEDHAALNRSKGISFRVLPTFRPDQAFWIGSEGFPMWVDQLGSAAGIRIETLEDLEAALEQRCNYFKAHGCRSADQGIEEPNFTVMDRKTAENAFRKARSGASIERREALAYQTELMVFLGKLYRRYDFVMQLHLGALRNINAKMHQRLGPDTGFDTMGESVGISKLVPLFRHLDIMDQLPKTILFSSNGWDTEKLNAFAACFQEEGVAGKVQTGAAWWFLDHKDGIEAQLRSFCRQGLLSSFAGMLTDSRSVLSMTRHEYYRRILCSLLGEWVENGELPYDEGLLGEIIRDVCYNNAVRFFQFEEKKTGE